MLNFSIQYYTICMIQISGLLCMKYDISVMYVLAIVFGLIPTLDSILKFDTKNPTQEEQKKLQYDARFKFPLYASIILDWIYTFYSLNCLLTKEYSLFHQFLILFLAGGIGGSGINVSHELFHKIETNEYIDFIIGNLNLSKSLYIHFSTEHNLGHHRNVATPNDPATSRKFQTVYEFFPQTIKGGFISAWKIECERLVKKYPNLKSVYHYKNRFFWYMGMNLTMIGLIFKKFGILGTFYFLIIAFISVLFLETVNYIEHYGLERKKLENGQYEKVTHLHSWNAPHRVSNYLLFKLQRHSDHHENSTKPYQILLSRDSSPTLPNGYAMMVVLAWFPSVYFDIMNRCLDNYKRNQELKEQNEEENDKYNRHVSQKTNKFIVKMLFTQALLLILSLYI